MKLDRIVIAGGGPIYDAVKDKWSFPGHHAMWSITKDRPIRRHDIEGADLLLCIGHPQVLTAELLSVTYCLNLHTSLLPRHRGRHPVNWAMIQGDREIGFTLHEMVPEIDAGPILVQWAVAMDPTRETYSDVMAKLAVIAPGIVQLGLEELRADNIKATPQDESLATYEPMRTPADSWLDWKSYGDYRSPAVWNRIACFINGQHPDAPAYDDVFVYRHVEPRR